MDATSSPTCDSSFLRETTPARGVADVASARPRARHHGGCTDANYSFGVHVPSLTFDSSTLTNVAARPSRASHPQHLLQTPLTVTDMHATSTVLREHASNVSA